MNELACRVECQLVFASVMCTNRSLKILSGKYCNRSRAHDEAVVDARVFAVWVAVAAVFVTVGVDA